MGKTALALHWAHQVASRFPDGQLYVNLHGFDPSGHPATATEAIRGFLDALGRAARADPASPEAQAGLYRSLLADRRMLIVLDNARDEQQVRPLLPASPGSLVLVTSRNQLSGLAAADGARLLSLDVLSHAEAVQLLAARLGTARAAAEPGGGRPDRQPVRVPAAGAGGRRGPRRRPARLPAGRPGRRARAIPPAAWTRWMPVTRAPASGRCSPGPTAAQRRGGADVPAAGHPPRPRHQRPRRRQPGRHAAEPEARRLLRELARAHLIAEHVPGRYAFHDLLRAYAAEQAARHRQRRRPPRGHWPGARPLPAHRRRAALLLDPAQEPVGPRPAPARRRCPSSSPITSRRWPGSRPSTRSCSPLSPSPPESGFDTHAWQLPWAMANFLQPRGHWQERAATQRTALAAATRLGDIAAQAVSSRLLASACVELGDYDQARGHFAEQPRGCTSGSATASARPRSTRISAA